VDSKKLKEHFKDALITIMVIIFASFITYRIGVWKGENNIAIQYDIKYDDTTHIYTNGLEERIPFRWFD
jgi:hypothetical protein